MTPRAVRAGAGLTLLYVVVALATAQLSSRPVLPLFDGFAPPTPYAWVNPPPSRAGDNVVPKPIERQFTLGPDGAPASNASTDDAQAIVGLDKGSVPALPPDTAISVRLIPTDAGTLGTLPPGLRVVSNAYQVVLAYLPSQTPFTQLPAKGTIALTAAEPADRLLYSADGQTWQETTLRPYGQDNGVFTELETVGWFVAASSSSHSGASSGKRSVQKGVLLAIAFVVPVAGAFLVVKLPSPAPAAPAPSPRNRGKNRNRPRR